MAPIALPLFELPGLASRERKLERIGASASNLLALYSSSLSSRWKAMKVEKSLGGSAEIVVSSTNNPADLPKTTNNAVNLMVGGGSSYIRCFCTLFTSMW